jgi:CubicO group peptidase (beta-lactamase class C family)
MWARKRLDFDPGTRWQYSNTNYVIAGVIIEKVSGMPLLQFLQTRVFTPLSMKSVANIDQEKLGDTDATGYLRYALGPPRLAPKEGKGWRFAAGELAMPSADLDDGPEVAEACVLPANGDGSSAEKWVRHAVRFGSGCHLVLGPPDALPRRGSFRVHDAEQRVSG